MHSFVYFQSSRSPIFGETFPFFLFLFVCTDKFNQRKKVKSLMKFLTKVLPIRLREFTMILSLGVTATGYALLSRGYTLDYNFDDEQVVLSSLSAYTFFIGVSWKRKFSARKKKRKGTKRVFSLCETMCSIVWLSRKITIDVRLTNEWILKLFDAILVKLISRY